MFLKSFLNVELSNNNHYNCDFTMWRHYSFLKQAVVYSLWCSPGALIEGNELHSQQCCQHVHSGLLTGKESLYQWSESFFAQLKPQFKHLPTLLLTTIMQIMYIVSFISICKSPHPPNQVILNLSMGKYLIHSFYNEKKTRLISLHWV